MLYKPLPSPVKDPVKEPVLYEPVNALKDPVVTRDPVSKLPVGPAGP
jgi:hypothetical protein